MFNEKAQKRGPRLGWVFERGGVAAKAGGNPWGRGLCGSIPDIVGGVRGAPRLQSPTEAAATACAIKPLLANTEPKGATDAVRP